MTIMGRNIDQCPSMLCVMMPAANDNGVETVMMAKLFTPLSHGASCRTLGRGQGIQHLLSSASFFQKLGRRLLNI